MQPSGPPQQEMADGTILIRWLVLLPAVVAELVAEAAEAGLAVELVAELARRPVRHLLQVRPLPEQAGAAVVEVEAEQVVAEVVEELRQHPQRRRISSAPNRICCMSRT